MSDENTTHFQFSLATIQLELSGDREFVERMYRTIMRDIEEARSVEPSAIAPKNETPQEKRTRTVPIDRQVVWVHRCSEMMHKIYMSSPEELSRAHLLRTIDPTRLSVVYAADECIDMILPKVEQGHTLWSELTEKGKAKIQSATGENP
jgi:hypothetical protein